MLSRKPTDSEKGRLAGAVNDGTDNEMIDLLWALLQSTEFQTW